MEKPRNRIEMLLAVVVLAGAAFARFYRLGEESIWLDEASTWIRSNLPPAELVANSIDRLHIPTYFLFMHYWLQIGDDEFMLRLPSAVFGSLAVAIALGLGVVVGGLRVGVLTGLICGLAHQLVRYSQEARMYCLYICFTTAALCGLLWLVKHSEEAVRWPFGRQDDGESGEQRRRYARRAWGILVVGSVCALYTHNTGVLFVASCWLVAGAVWIAVRGQRKAWVRNWLLAQTAVGLCWLPWVGTLLGQARDFQENFWAGPPDWAKISKTLEDLYLLSHRSYFPGLLVMGGVLLGLWALRRQKLLAASLVILSAATPALVWTISQWRPFWLPRIMLWGTIPYFVLAAVGVASIRSRTLVVLLSAFILVSGVRVLDKEYYRRHFKPRWREAIAFLKEETKERDVIYVLGGREKKPLLYYTGRKTDPVEGLVVKHFPRKNPERSMKNKRRAFLIYRKIKKEKFAEIMAIMKERGRRVRRKRFGRGVEVLVYRLHRVRDDDRDRGEGG